IMDAASIYGLLIGTDGSSIFCCPLNLCQALSALKVGALTASPLIFHNSFNRASPSFDLLPRGFASDSCRNFLISSLDALFIIHWYNVPQPNYPYFFSKKKLPFLKTQLVCNKR